MQIDLEKHKQIIAELKRCMESETGATAALYETHISSVLVSGDFAWKVKKPVDMGFLDFTTQKARLLFSRREVTLNRRLAPSVYLGLFPIFIKDKGLEIGKEISLDENNDGDGGDEWLIKMRRLPDERRFRSLLGSGKFDKSLLDELAELLTEFHDKAVVAPDVEWGKPEAFEYNMEENFTQIKPFVGGIFDEDIYRHVCDNARTDFLEKAPLIKTRRENNCLVDGHGDLHLDHVYAMEQLAVIDCLEFAERFRIADRVNDIAFLSMDFTKSGYKELAHHLVRYYASFSDDLELFKLIDTYRAYLAVVRAKVHALTAAQQKQEAQKQRQEQLAKEYLKLSYEFLAKESKTPVLVLTGGIIGSGKSTLAGELADRIGGVVLSSDLTRKRIAGISPYERREVPLDSGIYSKEMSEKTYLTLCEKAEQLLDVKITPVIDAAFARQEDRYRFARLAERANVKPFFIYTNCNKEETLKRLENRSKSAKRITDGRVELYDALSAKYEVPNATEGFKVFDADTTTKTPEELTTGIMKLIKK